MECLNLKVSSIPQGCGLTVPEWTTRPWIDAFTKAKAHI